MLSPAQDACYANETVQGTVLYFYARQPPVPCICLDTISALPLPSIPQNETDKQGVNKESPRLLILIVCSFITTVANKYWQQQEEPTPALCD